MKWYIVKQTSKATENSVFSGQTKITYYGKKNSLLAWDGDYYEEVLADPLKNNALSVRLYGYKREYDAKRNYSFKYAENNERWQRTAEIIAVQIVAGKVVEVES